MVGQRERGTADTDAEGRARTRSVRAAGGRSGDLNGGRGGGGKDQVRKAGVRTELSLVPYSQALFRVRYQYNGSHGRFRAEE